MSGGGGGGSNQPTQPTTPVAPPPPPPPWANLGVNTQQGYNTLMQTQAPGATAAQKGQAYNQLLSQGFNDAAIRSSADTLFGTQSNANWNELVTQGGMAAGRPLPGSAQFYQPVYQPQYQNYAMTNPMGVSQYGQTPDMFAMQTPFSMFGGQMQGGGYGAYGMNNPYSPYSNTFLNMPSGMQGYTADQKADVYRNAMQSGFNDQQIRNAATGLYGPQSNQAWGWLQGLSMGMTPGLAQGTMQDKVNFYNQAQGQGYNDQVIRNAANQMIGQQSQGDWAYLQGQAAPQMQSPFRSSGPSQAIVSRSAGMRGTPNVMRRAEGGIASLVGGE